MFNLVYNIPGLNKQSIIVISLLAFILFFTVLFQLFTCLAINEDAYARGVKKRTLFAVLGFFFPLPTVVVYLIVRNNLEKIQPKVCNNCGLAVCSTQNFCPRCGCNEFTDYLIVNNEVHKKRAKANTVAALVLYVLVLVMSLCIQFSGLLNTSNFARDNNNYSYNNGYQYNGDDDEFDDDSDNFDDFFNQFGDDQSGSQNGGDFGEEQPIQ